MATLFSESDPAEARVRIWDLPTRIFHWSLVVLIPFQWWTAEEDRLDLHILSGTVLLALLIFRILWGLVGSSTARFANFVRGPSQLFAYLRGASPPSIGHSPAGALSVMAMLFLLLAQVGLGLFAGDEDGIESGPLAHLIDGDLSEDLADLHSDAFDLLLVLIALHLAAIVFYALFQRKNLVGPMVGGRGRAPIAAGEMQGASPTRLFICIVIAAVVAWWIQAGLML